MKTKRILALFLSFLLILSSLGTVAFADEAAAVAKVGNTGYATIDDAIANWTNNTTLTLLADVILSDVITLNSTEHHILNLGTYTMTAASGKNAIVIKACGTGSAERSAITINADAANPGGINAGSKCVVYYKYADGGISTEDRPIIKINGGVFTGSTSSWGTAGIYSIGTAARKCATLNISGGTFNCSINGSGKSKLIITGGTFNYSVGSQGDSTANRLISGGSFKTLGFMTADDNNTKFWFGTSMGISNVGVYIDDNGYIVVGGTPIADAGDTFEASSANYSGPSTYLKYSSAKDNGLYYTSVEEAFADNNKTTGSVTVYVDELDMTDISYKGKIVVPEGNNITIKVVEGTTPTWKVSGSDVTYTDADGKVLEKNDAGSFEEPAPSVDTTPSVKVEGKADVEIQPVADTENSYEITLADGAVWTEGDSVEMTFPATSGAADGEPAYIVHKHGDDTYIYVGKVVDGSITITNNVGFSTFTVNAGGLNEALADANSMTGDVTVEIYDKVEYTDATPNLTGAYDTINFVGKTADAEISITRNGSNGYICGNANGTSNVTFTDLILSKPAGGYAGDAGFMNVYFTVYRAGTVTYTNCTFPDGACAQGGTVTYTGCTFANQSSGEYSLWVYANADVTVNGGSFTGVRGAKMYTESKSVEDAGTLSLEGVTFTESVIEKPAIVLTYGESVVLENNTYSSTGTFELDLDGAPNGTTVTSTDAITCVNDNGDCGVLVDGKIYTTVAQASEVATEGSTVTLLHNSTETVEFAEGVTLNKNGYTADGVTVEVSFELDGAGTEESPYLIKSLDDLKWFRDDVNAGNNYDGKVIALEADIDLNNEDWTPIGTSANQFCGMFDGKNHKISNLYINDSKEYVSGGNNENYVGLFGYMKGGDDAGIKNLIIENVNVTGCLYVGAVLGRSYTGGIIENCHVTGDIKIDSYSYTGGIVGRHEYSQGANINGDVMSMYNCSVIDTTNEKGTINADYAVSYVGGVVGFVAEGNYVFDKLSSSNVMVSGIYGVGGVSGIAHYGNTISNCAVEGISVISTNNDTTSNRTDNVGLISGACQGNESSPTVFNGNNIIASTGSVTYTDNTTSEITNEYGTKMDGTVSVTNYVAKIGDTYYETLDEAAAAAVSGDEIVVLADVNEDVTVPAGVIFNGNGKQVGTITAAGEITFKGHTKATNFGTQYTNTTINIGESACLKLTGTGRMVIGHGATFNITGSLTDAKNTDITSVTPSLIAAGASFTGTGLNFNVTNAYIKFTAYCSSKDKAANGTFNFNVTNSIWEQTGKLMFSVPTEGMDPTFNFNLKDSVLNSTSHLVFAVTKGEIVIDNSVVNKDAAQQLENRSTLTIKNGSFVNATDATSSNAIKPGTLIVDNATYVGSGEFSGSGVGIGSLILKNNANVSLGSISKTNITVDGTSLLTATKIADTTTTTVKVDASSMNVGDTKKVIDLSGSASIEGIVTVTEGATVTCDTDGDVTVTKPAVPEEKLKTELGYVNGLTRNYNGTDYYQVYLFGGIDSLSYENVGCEVIFDGETFPKETKTVYTAVKAGNGEFEPTAFGNHCKYIIGIEVLFPKTAENADASFTYRVFATKHDGKTIYSDISTETKVYQQYTK